jgi:hypothetical protein
MSAEVPLEVAIDVRRKAWLNVAFQEKNRE